MDRQENKDIFQWTARRAEQSSSFIAADLATYRIMQEMSEQKLATFLSCPAEALADLALCRRPDPSKPNFKTQVQRIASYVGCDGVRLATLLRKVDAINTFRGAAEDGKSTADTGLLAAARDARGEEVEPSRDAEDIHQDDEDPEHR